MELSIQLKKFEKDNQINKKKVHRKINRDIRINKLEKRKMAELINTVNSLFFEINNKLA